VKKLFIPFQLICCLHGFSQAVHYPFGSFYAVSGAYSRHFTQAFSFLSNQAALCHLSRTSTGIYTEKRFGMAALSMHLAAAAVPLKTGGVGLALQFAGFNAFNESRAVLAYGKNLGRINIGLQCNYHRLYMAGYGSDAAIGFELGALWSLTRKLVAGVQIANPLGGKFQRNSGEKLAAVYQLGAGYEASDQVCISGQIIKEENRPLTVLAAIQYNIVPNRLFAQLGITTATAAPFLGTGWQWRNCRMDLALQYHPQLGFSPGLLSAPRRCPKAWVSLCPCPS
jgi:hypothetical protein